MSNSFQPEDIALAILLAISLTLLPILGGWRKFAEYLIGLVIAMTVLLGTVFLARGWFA